MVLIEGRTSRRDKCEEITSGLCVEICDCVRCRLQTNSMSLSLPRCLHDLSDTKFVMTSLLIDIWRSSTWEEQEPHTEVSDTVQTKKNL